MSLVPLYLGIRAADSFVGTSSMMITAPDLGSVILKVNKQVKGSPWALCDNQDKTRLYLQYRYYTYRKCPRSCPCPYVGTDCGKQAPILRTVPVCETKKKS